MEGGCYQKDNLSVDPSKGPCKCNIKAEHQLLTYTSHKDQWGYCDKKGI